MLTSPDCLLTNPGPGTPEAPTHPPLEAPLRSTEERDEDGDEMEDDEDTASDPWWM